MACVIIVSYSILINGSPVGKIIPTREIRQDDPISPYLYLICTEGLSVMLQNQARQKQINGFKASRNAPLISHMFFADDSLIFCQTNEGECRSLLETLNSYGKVSGKKVNFQKSTIIFVKGLSAARRGAITDKTGIQRIGGFGRYLGLPEMIGRSKNATFSFIKQRVMQKLESWYSKLLPPAGKKVLVKAVATALPTYWMSYFFISYGFG